MDECKHDNYWSMTDDGNLEQKCCTCGYIFVKEGIVQFERDLDPVLYDECKDRVVECFRPGHEVCKECEWECVDDYLVL